MRIHLSEKAAEQLARGKKKPKAEDGDASPSPEEAEAKIEREAVKKAKREMKEKKVAARKAAFAADEDLEKSLAGVLNVEAAIDSANNRMEKDKDAHRIRVEREENTVKNLERQIENLQRDLTQQRLTLAEVKADVPASVAGMDKLQSELKEKTEALRSTFGATEEAWKNPSLTNSAKGKRNRKLRRAVKNRLG